MFSSPSAIPSGSSGSRRQSGAVATAALRSTGLVDEDVRMTDSLSGPKRHARNRIHERSKPSLDRLGKMERNAAETAKRTNMLSTRPKSNIPVLIKGASSGSLASRLGITESPSVLGRQARRPVSVGTRVQDAKAAKEPSSGRESVEVLREFVQKRYNPQTQFLNLENMAEDDLLRKYKIDSPDLPTSMRQIGSVVLKLAKELEPPCLTLSLANNRFVDTRNLDYIQHYLPQLANLSLENNKIANFNALDGLTSNRKSEIAVSGIKELVLTGNPVKEKLSSTAEIITYRSEVARRFPMLQMLDQQPIIPITFDVPLSFTAALSKPESLSDSFPVGIQGNLFGGQVDQMTGNFLTQFFPHFDNARISLLQAYSTNASFSVSADTTIAPRAKKRRLHQTLPNQHSLAWTWWLSESRNLSRIRHLDRVTKTLHAGPDSIRTVFEQMPATRHDLSKGDQFIVDAYPIPGILHGQPAGNDVLFVSVHGELAEGPSWGLRSFDRSFILALSAEGSPAKLAGWPCTIISDQLTIRSYSGATAWKPGSLIVSDYMNALSKKKPAVSKLATGTPAVVPGLQSLPALPPVPLPTQNPPGIDPLLVNIPEPQRVVVQELAARTGLTTAFSIQCLEGNGWDPDRAIANFEAVKVHKYPPEGFSR
ncbi:uncharacterized protein EI90DRAFT_3151245 [Cantharellus anzutake]|uniref:uncharacterized protein n=1 Tax=Cantharellus anzutake TaxID=1750568 RepID=UPI00190504FD|nr:uncharacterized protein EI90DRAFT_3151245 [Cantharellus anzutake]KAF8339792.1 hypothetical protein EI90DRAFT_3151245 [Cantharellus anzutake]